MSSARSKNRGLDFCVRVFAYACEFWFCLETRLWGFRGSPEKKHLVASTQVPVIYLSFYHITPGEPVFR